MRDLRLRGRHCSSASRVLVPTVGTYGHWRSNDLGADVGVTPEGPVGYEDQCRSPSPALSDASFKDSWRDKKWHHRKAPRKECETFATGCAQRHLRYDTSGFIRGIGSGGKALRSASARQGSRKEQMTFETWEAPGNRRTQYRTP